MTLRIVAVGFTTVLPKRLSRFMTYLLNRGFIKLSTNKKKRLCQVYEVGDTSHCRSRLHHCIVEEVEPDLRYRLVQVKEGE